MIKDQTARLYAVLGEAFPEAAIYNTIAPDELVKGDFVVFSLGLENVNFFLGGMFFEPVYNARIICVFNDTDKVSEGIEYLYSVHFLEVSNQTSAYDNEVGKTVITFNIFLNN